MRSARRRRRRSTARPRGEAGSRSCSSQNSDAVIAAGAVREPRGLRRAEALHEPVELVGPPCASRRWARARARPQRWPRQRDRCVGRRLAQLDRRPQRGVGAVDDGDVGARGPGPAAGMRGPGSSASAWSSTQPYRIRAPAQRRHRLQPSRPGGAPELLDSLPPPCGSSPASSRPGASTSATTSARSSSTSTARTGRGDLLHRRPARDDRRLRAGRAARAALRHGGDPARRRDRPRALRSSSARATCWSTPSWRGCCRASPRSATSTACTSSRRSRARSATSPPPASSPTRS